MPSALKPYNRVLAVVAGLVLTGLLVASLSSGPTPARAASIGHLQKQISAGQGVISNLAGAVGAANSKIHHLNGSISSLRAQIDRVQADLDRKRRELLTLRSELDAARTRLAKLEAFETRAQALLARQLVNNYESDKPDLVTVVLDASGFENLLETLSFQKRIRQQNVRVINDVAAARRAVTAQAIRLGALQVHQQTLTEDVLLQRNRLAAEKVGLVQRELTIARGRDRSQSKLTSARGRVDSLRRELGHLQAVQAAQAAAAARAAAPPSAASDSSSPSFSPPSSAGGFTFPLPKSAVVGPGGWSLDDGVDMSAPGGTPEYAVCSGTIVLHGIGGFGPWAPVLHCDSALDGYSYVYYGHAGPANQLPVGTHVGAGQVISEVGPGIVGISTGPHIEIGFCDASGNPIGPSSAGAMMALLHASY
jgi:murein DD-endopeptidase MepM/ murein hydrolase activator NlpD